MIDAWFHNISAVARYKEKLNKRSEELEEKKRRADVNCKDVCGKGALAYTSMFFNTILKFKSFLLI